MANEEQLAILRQGVDTWNRWRKDNLGIKLDLSGADLSKADLGRVNLNRANLSRANFSHADLRRASLSDANVVFAILSGANLSHANLSFANLSFANLSGANFSSANLSEANLSGANLSEANLSEVNLSHADLSEANLSHANLSFANLSHANLGIADLSDAKLSDAKLGFASLGFAKLSGTNLRSVDISYAKIGWTVFVDVDLSEVEGLETIEHYAPSSIGIDTIYKSKGKIPYKFLLDAGIPKDDITYLLNLAGKAIDFYSCFISYSSHDKAFAKRLHADLQAKGIRTWYAPEDLTPGEPILSGIDKGIRLHDKLLLVLSKDSVNSKWVEHEVESALAEELQPHRKAKMLFPIRLDNAVMKTDVDWAYRIRQTRHIGDFIQWKDHDTYQEAFDRLLRDLKMGEKG